MRKKMNEYYLIRNGGHMPAKNVAKLDPIHALYQAMGGKAK